ncbi:MAG: DUF502 domain-containing protein [Prolixibacteraceae bacterium]|jgi:uncharacterized membrane protein|nr:DUF502 domain-containing protein [Prolixibacteraceae bacterium]
MSLKRKFFNFSRTALLGGLVAILPLGIIVLLFRWVIKLIEGYLHPLVALFETNSRLATILVYVIAVVAILTLFFFIGLFVRTQFGKLIFHHIEKTYLSKLPFYKTIREIVSQFMGGNRSFFSEVVLVDIFNTGTLMTGFVTDHQESNDYITVFVPTGPNPTSGNIYHLPKNKVFKSTTSIDFAIKTIISCGAGSNAIFETSTAPQPEITNNSIEKEM